MPLSGMNDTAGAMFSFGGNPITGTGPTAKEMEEAAQAVLYNKIVIFEKIEIKTFVLNDKKDVEAYAEALMLLYKGVQAKTHVVLCHDKKFVEQPEARWIAHLEWAEYRLDIKANPVIGDNNGKAST